MPKTSFIEVGSGDQFNILFEDRSVLAIDKPASWMLVPFTWQKTDRNLQAAITSSIAAGAFWARSRNLKFLQAIHRLDAETTGVLLFVKNRGAIKPFSELFESRQMEKRYWAVLEGQPPKTEWTCKLPLGPDPQRIGMVKVDQREGKPAETQFRVLHQMQDRCFVEARPITGRTHQIRVHAAQSGHPVVGDPLYNPRFAGQKGKASLALRSIYLAYKNPFDGKPVRIHAPTNQFLKEFQLKHPDTSSATTPPPPPPPTKPQPAAPSPPPPKTPPKISPLSSQVSGWRKTRKP